MLFELRITNFRSFNQEQTFSLVAGKDPSHPENIFSPQEKYDLNLLKTTAIYGANASGKSNLLQAAAFIRAFVLTSAEGQEGDEIPVEPFRLDSSSITKPSEFEVTFLHEEVRYQYGFIVSRYDVHEEWLVAYPEKRAQRWFERYAGEETYFGPGLKGNRRQLESLTRSNALFLSVGAKFNHPQLTNVFRWFRIHWRELGHPQKHEPFSKTFTAQRCKNDRQIGQKVANFLHQADLGIEGLKVESHALTDRELPDAMTEEIKRSVMEQIGDARVFDVYTTHRLVNTKEKVEFLLSDESDGTQRMFAMAGPILDVLKNGYTLFVDELDTSLHPMLARKLLEIFHDPKLNTKGAQLVFTTHDTSLLDQSLMRRDQIWFTEKDDKAATNLYSLLEFKPRKGVEALQKGYFVGRYGALPAFGEFEF